MSMRRETDRAHSIYLLEKSREHGEDGERRKDGRRRSEIKEEAKRLI